jgi:hypothetical protein
VFTRDAAVLLSSGDAPIQPGVDARKADAPCERLERTTAAVIHRKPNHGQIDDTVWETSKIGTANIVCAIHVPRTAREISW